MIENEFTLGETADELREITERLGPNPLGDLPTSAPTWEETTDTAGDKVGRVKRDRALEAVDPSAAKALYARLNADVISDDQPELSKEDVYRVIFKNDRAVEEMRDRYGDSHDGRMRYASDLLFGVANGYYLPSTVGAKEDFLSQFKYFMTQGRTRLFDTEFGIPGDNAEAQFNSALQVLKTANDRKSSLAEALMSDRMWRIYKTLSQGVVDTDEDDEKLINQFIDIGAELSNGEGRAYYLFDPETLELAGRAGTSFTKGVKQGVFTELNGPEFAVEQGGMEGFPIVTKAEAAKQIDFGKAKREQRDDGYSYYTIDGPRGVKRYALPMDGLGFDSDRWVVMDTDGVARWRRQQKFSRMLSSEEGKRYRDYLKFQMKQTLSPAAYGWLRTYTNAEDSLAPDSAIAQTFLVHRLDDKAIAAFCRLGPEDREKIMALVKLAKPTVNTSGSYAKTMLYGLWKGTESTVVGLGRGVESFGEGVYDFLGFSNGFVGNISFIYGCNHFTVN